jgi:hypothetical protein
LIFQVLLLYIEKFGLKQADKNLIAPQKRSQTGASLSNAETK